MRRKFYMVGGRHITQRRMKYKGNRFIYKCHVRGFICLKKKSAHYVIYMCIEMGWKMEARNPGKPLKDSNDVQWKWLWKDRG